MLPDYFFEVAASSTGKYHPSYSLGKGGLVRHTKSAVAIAKDLLGLEMYAGYTEQERSAILAALILHDGVKHGMNGSAYTTPKHPTECVDWLLEHEFDLPDDVFEMICGCIASHMGQWNSDRYGNVILPKPKTKLQKFVHQCDYLASRKYLEVNFDAIHYGGNRV